MTGVLAQIAKAKIYTADQMAMVQAVANEMVEIAKDNRCGLKFTDDDIKSGVFLMYLDALAPKAKLLDQLTPVGATIQTVCNTNLSSKNFSPLKNFEQVYFAFLFRMCHAKYLAIINDADGFLFYLNDNEKVRRIIRPKYGVRLAPLMKINTKIFSEMKKQLSNSKRADDLMLTGGLPKAGMTRAEALKHIK